MHSISIRHATIWRFRTPADGEHCSLGKAASVLMSVPQSMNSHET